MSDTFVADPDMKASPPFFRIGADAVTSWLPAGPITPRMLEFDAIDCETTDAFAGSSWVSPWTIVIWSLCVLFHVLAKNCAQWSWSSPIDATGPVNGPIMPIWIGFEHESTGSAAEAVRVAGLAAAAKTSATDAHALPIPISSALLTIKPPSKVGLTDLLGRSAYPKTF